MLTECYSTLEVVAVLIAEEKRRLLTRVASVSQSVGQHRVALTFIN
jgi:hypothetical protein